MKVNSKNTTLVCFSDALGYEADTFIEDEDEQVIRGVPYMMALGVRLSNKPDWAAHGSWVCRSVRSRLWTLMNLKRSVFNTDELLTVYK